jgi:hypothetical protein
MKRLPLFLWFVALLQNSSSFAQDSAQKIAVVVSPALFMPVTVAAQGGVQFSLGQRWALLAEGAYPLFKPLNTGFQRVDYWRAGMELRRQLRKRSFKRYLAFQTNYLYRELEKTNGGNYYTRDRTFAYTNAVVKSPVLSTTLKLGTELPVGKRSYFDLFAGAGVRMIFNRYITQSALVTSIDPEEHNLFTFNNAWLYNFTLIRPHLTAGLRFGYRL